MYDFWLLLRSSILMKILNVEVIADFTGVQDKYE